jgi:hypothetical protein
LSTREICVSVELLDRETGELMVSVDDPDNPEPGDRFQDMILHPAAGTLLNELLTHYAVHGVSVEQTIKLNVPAVTP